MNKEALKKGLKGGGIMAIGTVIAIAANDIIVYGVKVMKGKV